MFTFHPDPSPLANQSFADQYETPFLQAMGAEARQSLKLTTPLQIYDRTIMAAAQWDGDTLTKFDWENSKYFRPGLKWFQGLTEQAAEILSARHDSTTRDQFLASRGGIVPALLGGLAGSLPDPINFIPILGPASRAAATARFGKVAGSALVSSAEAAIMTAAIQPFTIGTAETFQENYDLWMAAETIAYSAVIGGAFGSIRPTLSRMVEKVRVRAMSKALRDVIEGEPVDVSPEMPPQAHIARDLNAEIADIVNNPRREFFNDGGFGRDGLEPNMTPRERARSTIEILQRPENKRTAAENHFINTTDIPPEIHRALDIFRRPAKSRTKDEKAFLAALTGEKLPDYYRSKIAATEKRVAALEAKVKKAPLKEGMKAKLVPDGQEFRDVPRGIGIQKRGATKGVKEFAVEMENDYQTKYDPNMPEVMLESREGGKWDVVELGRADIAGEGSFAQAPRNVRAQGLKLADAKKLGVDILKVYDLENPGTLKSAKAEPPTSTGSLDELVSLKAEIDGYNARLDDLQNGKPLHYGVARDADPHFPEVEPTTEKNVNQFDDVEEIQAMVEESDAELRAMESEGLLSEADRNDLAEARTERKRMEGWAKAYDDAAICVVRNA